MAKSPAETAKVINDADVAPEILASAIVSVAEGIKKLRAGRLSDRALLILIQDACPERIGIERIRMVIDAMASLQKKYVK